MSPMFRGSAADCLQAIGSGKQREKQIPDNARAEQEQRPARQPALPKRCPREQDASADHERAMERVEPAEAGPERFIGGNVLRQGVQRRMREAWDRSTFSM